MLLWVGWVLFNAGSGFAINGDKGVEAARAITNTLISPSAAGLVCFFLDKRLGGNQDIRYNFAAVTNGILAGAVAITASSDRVENWAAVVIGIIGAFVYMGSVHLVEKLKIDDPLEATQVHGFNGLWGTIALAFFKKDEGILYGGPKCGRLLVVQLVGALFFIVWSALCSGIYFGIAKKLNFLRLPYSEEVLGGDIHYFAPLEFVGNPKEYGLMTSGGSSGKSAG